jgi:hypothetical protein
MTKTISPCTSIIRSGIVGVKLRASRLISFIPFVAAGFSLRLPPPEMSSNLGPTLILTYFWKFVQNYRIIELGSCW